MSEVEPPRTFGLHIHSTLVAPAAANRSWMWRKAAMYSALVLPLTPMDQGYQLPFISWAKRRISGFDHAAAPWAQAVMYESNSPLAMPGREYVSWSIPNW